MTSEARALTTLKGTRLHIGICDSGLGGLSILGPVARALAGAQISYVADDRYAPYGSLDKETLINRAVAIAELLLARGCDLIVVACNTLTAQAIDELRARFDIPFVGVEPYVNALNKGLPADARPAILCTVSTAKSERFHKLVVKCDPKKRSLIWPCPTLARQIERVYRLKLEGLKGAKLEALEEQVILSLKEDLEALKGQQLTHAILGCTHYPLVRQEIESYLGLPTLSPCEHVARRVEELVRAVYERAPESGEASYDFFATSLEKWVLRPLADATQLG